MKKQSSNEQLFDRIINLVEHDREKIALFFSKLVQCKTPSDPGDTRSAANLIKDFLEHERLPYKEITADEIMPNIISTVNMEKQGRHIMFNGHLDVMPAGKEPGWTDSPWSGKIHDGKVWGRGTSDMKAGVTAMLFAFVYLSRLSEDLCGKATLTLVSDEETGYERGTGFLFEQIEKEMLADCVLSAEPSGTDSISFASKGYVQFTVNIHTRGAIAGYPNESKSAIMIAASIIHDLKELEDIEVELPHVLSEILTDDDMRKQYEQRRGNGESELLNRITVDITTINGGDLISVIASECSFSAAVVIPVGADPYAVYRKAFDIVSRYPEAELIFEGVSVGDLSAPNHEMVKILQDTVTRLGREKPVPVPDIAISDCRHWRYRGIPAFWYGPDGSRCSAANEYVEIEELLHLVRTHTLAAAKYLGNSATKIPHIKNTLLNTAKPNNFIPEIRSVAPIYAACLSGTSDSFKSTF